MVESLLIKQAQVITPSAVLHDGWLLCVDGKISAIGQGNTMPDADRVIDAAGRWLMPGFIDVHVHGGAGHEAMDATPEALTAMAQFYARHGVTSFLPTTWTDTGERILKALQVIASMIGRVENGATILGAHVEGPYLNPDRCGAQNVNLIRRADRDEAMAWLDTGAVRLMAIAPEYQENEWLIETCMEYGVVVSAAHTSATFAQMQRAVDLGLRQTTHTYNAMSPLNHREPGVVGAALTLMALKCELIADNIHVHPAAMQVLWQAKGRHGVILISDAVRGAGMPDGEYPLDDRMVMIRDGAIRLLDGTLAGSALTMDRALKNFMTAVDEPVSAVWQASSANAARALGIDGQKGSIEIGKDADLVLIDDGVNVALTVAEGRVVYEA